MLFEIPLVGQKVKPHQVTALHLVVGFALLACSAIALLINNTVLPLPDAAAPEVQKVQIEELDAIDISASVIMVFSIIILAAALFRNKWLRSESINKTFRFAELMLLVIIAGYLVMIQYNVLAAIFGLLAATIVFALNWEAKNNSVILITVNEDGIKPPVSLRRRSIKWMEVESALLRHGTFTVNCTDNRLYQWMTAANEIDPEIFEAYCMAQIEAAKKNRTGSDW